jgi:hypothetical protein
MKALTVVFLLTCTVSSTWANMAEMYKSQASIQKKIQLKAPVTAAEIDHARVRRVNYLRDILNNTPRIPGQLDQKTLSVQAIINAELKNGINYETVFTEVERDIVNDDYYYIVAAKMERMLKTIINLSQKHNIKVEKLLVMNTKLIKIGKTLKVRSILLSKYAQKQDQSS